MVLTAVRLATRDTNLYTFRRADGATLPGARPGAHIVLHLPNGVERQYSLVDTGDDLKEYTVGVKLDPNSRGGSLYMHNQLRAGIEIQIESPRNNFPLIEDAEHVVLFAGGIGITPITSMVKRLVELGRSWELYYSSRSRADAAFREELEQHSQVHFHFDDEKGGVLPIGDIIAKLPKNAHLYCCGPMPMLSAFENATVDWPPGQLHVEYFTPKFTAAEEGGYIVELTRSKKELTIPPKDTGRYLLHYGYAIARGPTLAMHTKPDEPERGNDEADDEFEARHTQWESERRNWNPIRYSAPHPATVLLDPLEADPTFAIEKKKFLVKDLHKLTVGKKKKRIKANIFDTKNRNPYDRVDVVEW
ncbi:MAG: ferredoxin reductase, partial [Proteobacteria bacterium]|nr:ferredoxin reductase [Pseudomonadota bacterium]